MPVIPVDEIRVDADGNFVMSPQTLRNLTGYTEEDSGAADAEKGRKDYCCHNNDDHRCHVIRASNSASAAVKCMGHYAGRPVTSHEGSCDH